MNDLRFPVLLPIHLTTSLCSRLVTPFSAPMEALTPARLSPARRGIPDSRHLNLSVVLSPTTACRSISAFPTLVVIRVLDSSFKDRFSSAPFQVSGVRHSLADSPRHRAESSFYRTDRQTRLPLLSTPPLSDAVTVGFQPVERLVERSSHPPFSGALSGARVRASRSQTSGRCGCSRARRARLIGRPPPYPVRVPFAPMTR